ncbi:hypothetical protein DOS83_14390 [Staphylococcus felis]|uniref:Uncharacterized protein n=1 Tax=Staphylococcus felis TaxID=46127 RepID=A0A3E0IKD4_9STAP|nr:hypothetical protein DOS61_07275 [Staphylococcus felis]REH88196.1 hypothetical protein DOS83_14390 [Staphylococcus felis]REH92954.1 hypothetical protein DOS58_00160 [Staphylococcus felis]
MIINNTLRLAHLPFLMRDWRNQFVKKNIYKIDKTFLIMAMMSLPLVIIMPIFLSIPLVLLVFSIKKHEDER